MGRRNEHMDLPIMAWWTPACIAQNEALQGSQSDAFRLQTPSFNLFMRDVQ